MYVTRERKAERAEEAGRWGLSVDAVRGLGDRLIRYWGRYAKLFKSRTRDTSSYGLAYLSGLLRMVEERNFTRIGRAADVEGQNIQHFMAKSPWRAGPVLAAVRAEMGAVKEFASGGMLLLDESCEEKAGKGSAGVGRQYNGRLGKIEMSQVGTFLAYANHGVWTWVDGELFVPEEWFGEKMARRRKETGVPLDRVFETKVELGWRMIERVKQEGTLPFEAVDATRSTGGVSG